MSEAEKQPPKSEPDVPTEPSGTILQRIARAIRDHNWFVVGIEVIIVVLGVLIGLQVNNWNEQRKQDERIRFGLREIYDDVRGYAFRSETFTGGLNEQIALIDSLLDHGQDVTPSRLPAMIQILDVHPYGNDGVDWRMEFLTFDPSNERRNEVVEALRDLLSLPSGLRQTQERFGFEMGMTRHLQRNGIPVRGFTTGHTYASFIDESQAYGYTSDQLERASALLNDEVFIADLMSLRNYKEYLLLVNRDIPDRAEPLLAAVQEYDPAYDFSIQHMEIVGSGLREGGWDTGTPMARVSAEDDRVWEAELELVDGEVKFRTDPLWTLDWGRGGGGSGTLGFMGPNIPVEAGHYRVRMDIREGTVRFTPIDS